MKRVPITVTVRTYADVPDDWDDGNVFFFVEENHCIWNDLARVMDAEKPGVCNICSFSDARVGHFLPGTEPAPKRDDADGGGGRGVTRGSVLRP